CRLSMPAKSIKKSERTCRARRLRRRKSGDRLNPSYSSCPVRYLSTRDPHTAPLSLSFAEVLLAGLAEDGGLYVPDRLPTIDTAALRGWTGRPYSEIAAGIVSLFAGASFPADELQRLATKAYGRFRHKAVAPLVQLDERLWLLELFHGPTLAFKDLALQLVGLLFDAVLAQRQEHVTIIGATSGDTGSGRVEGRRDRGARRAFLPDPPRPA